MQNAIIAIAHPQPVLERLDVNVGGVRLYRPRYDLVDQSNHRRFAGEVLQSFGVFLERRPGLGLCLLGLTLGRIQAFQRCLQLDGHGDFQSDAPAAGRRDRGRGEVVERVGGGEHQRVILDSDRHGARLAQEARCQAFSQQGFGGRIAARIRNRQVEQGRIALRETTFRQKAELNQHAVQPLPGFGRHAAGTLDRPAVALSVGDKQPGKRVYRLIGRGRLQMDVPASVLCSPHCVSHRRRGK